MHFSFFLCFLLIMKRKTNMWLMFLKVLFRDSQALILSCSISSCVVVQIWSVVIKLCQNEQSIMPRQRGIWIVANVILTGMTQRWGMSTLLHEHSAKSAKKKLKFIYVHAGEDGNIRNKCCLHGNQTFLLIVHLCFSCSGMPPSFSRL